MLLKLGACLVILITLIISYIILCKLYISMLTITGLSKSVARFQVFSLFIGCGFTTGESELIMYNKTRRKIALATMITGFIFASLVTGLIIGVVAGLDFSKAAEEAGKFEQLWVNLLLPLIISIVALVMIVLLTKIPALKRWFYTRLEKLMTVNSRNIEAKGNPIVYELYSYDKYLAQITLKVLPDILKDTRIGDINFKKVGITILMVNMESNGIITTDVDNIVLKEGAVIDVFGDVTMIERIFSMKSK